MRKMSSREANQDFSRAKREALAGPVIITERGRPANVLMTYDHYRRLAGESRNILDQLAIPGAEDIELDLPERMVEPVRVVE